MLNRSADAAEAAMARDARESTVFSPLLNPIGDVDTDPEIGVGGVSASSSSDGRHRSSEHEHGLRERHNRQSRASQDGHGHHATFSVHEEAFRAGMHAVAVPVTHEELYSDK